MEAGLLPPLPIPDEHIERRLEIDTPNGPIIGYIDLEDAVRVCGVICVHKPDFTDKSGPPQVLTPLWSRRCYAGLRCILPAYKTGTPHVAPRPAVRHDTALKVAAFASFRTRPIMTMTAQTATRWQTDAVWRLLVSAAAAMLWFGTNGCVSAELTVDASDVRFQKETPPWDADTYVCGDGVRDGFEVCDGDDFGWRASTCADLGYESGELRCADDCSEIFYDDCIGSSCGNGILDDDEMCDEGSSPDTQCPYEEECLLCVECQLVPGTVRFCGDGVVDNDPGEWWEACDGDALSPTLYACEELGYDGGELSCTEDCDVSYEDCTGSVCGNGIVEGDELCDEGDDPETECPYGEECLVCVNCEEVPGTMRFCGDGVRDTFDGEECDLDEPVDCTEFGYESGTVTCASGCLWDYSDCERLLCGDGEVQDGELCEPGDVSFDPCLEEFERLGLTELQDASTFGGEAVCTTSCDDWALEDCTVGGEPLYDYLANQESPAQDAGIAEPSPDGGASDAGVLTPPTDDRARRDDGCTAAGNATGLSWIGVALLAWRRRRKTVG